MAATLVPDALWDLVEPFLADSIATAKRRAAAPLRSRVPHRHSLRPSQRHSLADAPVLTLVRIGDDGLVARARLATGGVWSWSAHLSWLNQFRRLRVQYDKRADIHEAFLSRGCALMCWQSLRKTWMTPWTRELRHEVDVPVE